MNVWVYVFFSLLVACVSTQKSRKLSMLFIRFVIHFVLISAEDVIWRKLLRMPGPFPRNIGEIYDNPKRFETLLRRNGVISNIEAVADVRSLADISSEPDKNVTAGSIVVTVKRPDVTREIKMFCKFQTGRGMPKWLQAIRAAAEPGVCREVDFYAQVRQSVPVRTLKPYLTLKSPSFNYVFVALEYIDLENSQARVVNDATSATMDEVRTIVVNVAKIHRRFISAEEPETSWIPAKAGLEYAQFVESFLKKTESAWTHKVWGALKRYFATRPVTLVHGDCRPGNMMFEGDNRDNVKGIIFADWEATNVGPILWDFTYCTILGWTADSRRKHVDEVLDAYLNALADQCVAAQCPVIRKNEAEQNIAMLTLVLGYVARVVRVMKFWENQGNTNNDKACWFVRVALAISDLDAEMISGVLGLDRNDIINIQNESVQEVRDVGLFPSEETWSTI